MTRPKTMDNQVPGTKTPDTRSPDTRSPVLHECLRQVSEGRALTKEQAEAVFMEIMAGNATPAQIGGLLVGLRVKGETRYEITGAAMAMRRHAVKIPVKIPPGDVLMDTCGTGGDSSGTFNISTTVAFVLAGAGVKVAKHGNRSITSRSGSADCLEALGKDLNLSPEEVSEEIDRVGIGFLFAQRLHPAMGHAAGVRKELGIKTIFNVLGPLTNPAGATHQLMGVFSRDLLPVLARVLGDLGSRRAWVVHGDGGLDELSISGQSWVAEWTGSEVREFQVFPEDAGLPRSGLDALKGGGPEENARILRGILNGEVRGAKRDAVLLNAGGALVVCQKASDLKEGVDLARDVVDSGRANEVLNAYIGYHHRT